MRFIAAHDETTRRDGDTEAQAVVVDTRDAIVFARFFPTGTEDFAPAIDRAKKYADHMETTFKGSVT